MLLFAGIALIAFSIYTLGVATSEDVPGNPYYYVVRQSIYAVVGIALMFAVARIDYSRFRELRVGIYTAMIGLIVLVLLLGEATRGSRRWIELPFFTFQPSELGKVLLIVTLAAFVIDRSRRQSRSAGGRCGSWRSGCSRRRSSSCSRTSARRSSTAVITLAVLFIAGVRWTHFAAIARRGGGGHRDRARDRSRRRYPYPG